MHPRRRQNTTTSKMSASTRITTRSSKCSQTGDFGDYFKREAIDWAWELVTEVWKFPKERLYATVYKPGPGDPSELDQEAWTSGPKNSVRPGSIRKSRLFYGNKKTISGMMGDTGPVRSVFRTARRPHAGRDTQGNLVNKGDARCIEIWNLVFIQIQRPIPTAPLPRCRRSTSIPAWVSNA